MIAEKRLFNRILPNTFNRGILIVSINTNVHTDNHVSHVLSGINDKKHETNLQINWHEYSL